MTAHVLSACGRDPAFLVGGELRSAQMQRRVGRGDWIVVEADESDRSFLELKRDVAVITNIELDHHTTTVAVRPQGRLRRVRRAREHRDRPVRGCTSKARSAMASSRGAARRGCSAGPMSARARVEGCSVELRVPGNHNVLNALAALAACRDAGVPIEEAAPALAEFGAPAGASRSTARPPRRAGLRRLRPPPDRGAATIAAARTLDAAARRRLLPATSLLAHASSWRATSVGPGAADVVVVLDVYPARERAEDFPGVTGLLVAQAAAGGRQRRRVLWLPGMSRRGRAAAGELRRGRRAADVGAGTSTRWRAGDRVERWRVSAPAGVQSELPARAPDDRPDRGHRRVLRAPGDEAALDALSRVGGRRGDRGRSGGFRIEPARQRAGFRGLVMKLDGDLATIEREGKPPVCGGGARLPRRLRVARAGLPGSSSA